MKLPTQSKRRLIYNRRLDPASFLLFFHKGTGPDSWSVRDYSVPGSVAIRYAADFCDDNGQSLTALDVERSTEIEFPAETHTTNDLGYWHEVIKRKNGEYGKAFGGAPRASIQAGQGHDSAGPETAFPIMNLSSLMAMPKARKRGDLDRMLYSRNSEDYVTWNFFQMLQAVPAPLWWPAFLSLAGNASIDPLDTPDIRLWRSVKSPASYKAARRTRMTQDDSFEWRERSERGGAVEGRSEIDIVLEGRTYLAFVEAKLGSDVSLRTTHDPARNQIVRNIDCVLDQCGNKRPVFWMVARDRHPERAYVQLMREYSSREALARALPHQKDPRIGDVAGTLAIISWAELLPLLGGACGGSLEGAVREELERRVNVPARRLEASPPSGRTR